MSVFQPHRTPAPSQKVAPCPPLPVNGPAHGKSLRIAIVSHEFSGPGRNNGLGMAYTALAEALAGDGHKVICLYTATDPPKTAPGNWAEYFKSKNIEFIALPPGEQEPAWLHRPYEAYQWLKEREFDVIHCPEYPGNAYYICLAKQAGLEFAKTRICIGVHGPSMWARQLNRHRINDIRHLAVDAMERQSIALADTLISPSQYMTQWLRQQGIELPAETYVQQNIMPPSAMRAAVKPGALKEIVFFGRIEPRKGYALFCDAIDLLPPELLRETTVTFLGSSLKLYEGDSADLVRQRAANWPCKWQILDDKSHEDALAYLRDHPCFAVMPSQGDNSPYTVLECLGVGIPFLASHAGGIPELIAEEDISRACFFPIQANILAERIAQALSTGLAPAKPAVDFDANRQNWLEWHRRLPEFRTHM